MVLLEKRSLAAKWFEELRDKICASYEEIELEYANTFGFEPAKFQRKAWEREGGGGGVISMMRGRVFEKVGVNISTVHGVFSPEFAKQIPGADTDPKFFATGISLVSHMKSPLVPAAHFNTRYIETTKSWFGGGGDMTPTYHDHDDTRKFHLAFKEACDKHNPEYYPKFKKECDEYFFIKHRNEPRGIGGIFYDYLNTENFDNDFLFTKDVGKAFYDIYPKIIRPKMMEHWGEEQKKYQLEKRGRYVEFNLLYDRGTKFGLMTGGNVDAILMSMPPEVTWS
jgi:coproporphyrinogen III oxidase